MDLAHVQAAFLLIPLFLGQIVGLLSATQIKGWWAAPVDREHAFFSVLASVCSGPAPDIPDNLDL